jgi:hypothetical protein
MAALFDDDTIHLGMDEVVEPSPCTANATLSLEAQLIDIVSVQFGKQVMGWNPIASVVQQGAGKGGKGSVIVNSYMGGTSVVSTLLESGFDVVDSSSEFWYFTHPAGWDLRKQECRPAGCAGAKGWDMCWHAPGGNATSFGGDTKTFGGNTTTSFGGGTSSRRSNGKVPGQVLGGEMSVWTDDYVKRECGAHGSSLGLANASCFYDRSMDVGYEESIGGLVWPRGIVAAGAFYNYDAALNASSAGFVERIHAMNDQLKQRGSFVCPSLETCSYVGAGNVLYPGVDKDKLDGYSCKNQE